MKQKFLTLFASLSVIASLSTYAGNTHAQNASVRYQQQQHLATYGKVQAYPGCQQDLDACRIAALNYRHCSDGRVTEPDYASISDIQIFVEGVKNAYIVLKTGHIVQVRGDVVQPFSCLSAWPSDRG